MADWSARVSISEAFSRSLFRVTAGNKGMSARERAMKVFTSTLFSARRLLWHSCITPHSWRVKKLDSVTAVTLRKGTCLSVSLGIYWPWPARIHEDVYDVILSESLLMPTGVTLHLFWHWLNLCGTAVQTRQAHILKTMGAIHWHIWRLTPNPATTYK